MPPLSQPSSHHDEISRQKNEITCSAWMPLDGFIQQWADLGAATTESRLLHVTSDAFRALSHETEAHRFYQAALRATGQEDQFITLQCALEALHCAHTRWDSIVSVLADVLQAIPTVESLSQPLLFGMQQRLRVSGLLQQVEREALARYQHCIGVSYLSGHE